MDDFLFTQYDELIRLIFLWMNTEMNGKPILWVRVGRYKGRSNPVIN